VNSEKRPYYKRVLEETPGAIPGWVLEPGDVRRSIEDPHALPKHMASLFSLQEFLGFCSPSVPLLERAWAEKSGIPINGAKEAFKKFLGGLLTEERCAPSLSRLEKLLKPRQIHPSN
jgi:hypothetical protein